MPWQPTASFQNLKARSSIISEIRHFFAARNVWEVDTPLIGTSTATDPHIGSFKIPLPGSQKFGYLQTSPEFPMKRLIAAGSGSIFQICKAFRLEEKGNYHNPEFTMLEWYRVGYDHWQLMAEVDALLQHILHTEPADKMSYLETFQHFLSIDPYAASISELQACAEKHGIHFQNSSPDSSKDFWLQLLLSHAIEPHLGHQRPFCITDFPITQAALSRAHPSNPQVAERFEVYVRGIELANGYHELTDPQEQRRRFGADNAQRRSMGLPEIPLDEDFLAALNAGMPDCAGVALGVDRLVMLALNNKSIQEVVTFA